MSCVPARRTRPIAVFAVLLLLVSGVSAQKRFYVAPDDHTDYYWTADGNAYRQAFLTMTDYYLDLYERLSR